MLLTAEGPEIAFPKTKSVLATTGLLMRLGLAMAAAGDAAAKARLMHLHAIPDEFDRNLGAQESRVCEALSAASRCGHVAFAGDR